MNRKSFIRLCLSGSLMLLAGMEASCQQFAYAEETDSFYQKSRQGWFWYQNPPAKEEKEKKKKPVKRQLPSLAQYSIQELWNMYPDDFQKLLNIIQKKAVQAPTEANITDYLTMQDIARRKALAYTSATMYVTQKHSDRFTINSVYPTTRPGVLARVNMQKAGSYPAIFS